MDSARPQLEPPPNLERLHASRAAYATPASASTSKPVEFSHGEQDVARHEALSEACTARRACLGQTDHMDVDEGTPHMTASSVRPPSPVADVQSRALKPPMEAAQLDAATACSVEQVIRSMHRAYTALRVKADVLRGERTT